MTVLKASKVFYSHVFPRNTENVNVSFPYFFTDNFLRICIVQVHNFQAKYKMICSVGIVTGVDRGGAGGRQEVSKGKPCRY